MKGQIFACLSKNNFVNYELRRDFTVKVTKHWHSFFQACNGVFILRDIKKLSLAISCGDPA